MIYGYIRVSTDKQTVENQRYEISKYVKKENIFIDRWIEETVSGTVCPDKRNLGLLINQVSKGDVIVCSEISRLGRSMFMIMSILNTLMEREVLVYTVKEGYKLGCDLQSKVLAFAFSISAEIERTLISDRTKEALRRKKAEGKIIGRPKGSKNKQYKLSNKEDYIRKMLLEGKSKTYIYKSLKVSSATFYNFCKKKGLFF